MIVARGSNFAPGLAPLNPSCIPGIDGTECFGGTPGGVSLGIPMSFNGLGRYRRGMGAVQLTGPSGTVSVGQSWVITISGAPANSPVSFGYTDANGNLLPGQIMNTLGNTDGNGVWSWQGSFAQASLGPNFTTWAVGGQKIGNISYTVVPAGSSTGGSGSAPGTFAFVDAHAQGQNVFVGDPWTISISGSTPNSPVSFGYMDPSTGANLLPGQIMNVLGNTDGNGNWGWSGKFDASALGPIWELWQVGGKKLADLKYTINQVSAAPPPTVNPVPTMAGPGIFSFSDPNAQGQNVFVGDPWTISITNAPPNSPVSFGYMDPSSGATLLPGQVMNILGNTDAKGNWGWSGKFDNSLIGPVWELWQVGGQKIADLRYIVNPAPGSTPVSAPPPVSTALIPTGNTLATPGGSTVAGSPMGGTLPTGGGAAVSTTPSWLSQSTIISGIPDIAVYGGGAAALLILLMVLKK